MFVEDEVFGEVDLRNDEPTWERTIGELVGPAASCYRIINALGSKTNDVSPDKSRVVTSLPPRRGGGRGVTLRLQRIQPPPSGSWAALVVLTEDLAPKMWRLR